MAERGGLGRGLADVVAAGGGGGGGDGGGLALAGVLHDLAGLGVDVVLILDAAGVELDLVDHDAVLAVEVGLDKGHVAGADARVGVGGGLGVVDADVGLGAGSAGLADAGVAQAAGAGDEADVVDGEGSEGLDREGRVGGDDLEYELGLALGDAVLLGKRGGLAGGGDGLGEHRGLKAALAHGAVYHVADLLLQALGLGRVAVGDGDEDGVADVVQVAVHEHGADEGVDGDVEVGAGEVHVADDGPGVVVEGLDFDDLVGGVNYDVEAGVDVEGDYGVHDGVAGYCAGFDYAAGHAGVGGGAVAVSEVSAEADQHEGGGHGYGDEAVLLLLVVVDFVHRYYCSFPGFAGFEDTGELIRGRVLGKAANSCFHHFIIHHSASSAAFPSFFMAR